jgi:hypothetical protein
MGKDSVSRSDHGRQLSNSLVPQAANTASRGNLTQHRQREPPFHHAAAAAAAALFYLFSFLLSSLFSSLSFLSLSILLPFKYVHYGPSQYHTHTDQKDTPSIFLLLDRPWLNSLYVITGECKKSLQPSVKDVSFTKTTKRKVEIKTNIMLSAKNCLQHLIARARVIYGEKMKPYIFLSPSFFIIVFYSGTEAGFPGRFHDEHPLTRID